ncbi:hypothetical protein QNM99_18105 [Pseudomonas sp. PCH446]
MPDSYIFPVAPFLDWGKHRKDADVESAHADCENVWNSAAGGPGGGSIAVSAAPSKVQVGTDAYVRRMIEATRAAWPALAEFNEVTHVFADIQLLTSNGRRAWLMSAHGGQEIDMAAVRVLGPSYEYKSFDKFRWQGRPAVFVGMGEALPEDEVQRLEDPQAVPELFGLATHEAFHFYAEAAWAHHPGAERSIRYPPLPSRGCIATR